MASTISVRVRPARLIMSLAAAMTLVATGSPGSTASAQDQSESPALRRPRASDGGASPAPSRPRPTDFDDGTAASEGAGASQTDDTSIVPPEDTDSEQPRPAGRPILKDGDLSDDRTPPPRDGVADIREPEVPVDGADPTTVDTRSGEEAALFENPPSPPDPQLFEIEDTEPILDRRPARLFRFEPFDPVGIKAGSFVLFPEIEFGGSANSNVFRATPARSDVTFDVRPSARFVSNWTRNAFEFRATGLASFYNEFSSENDKAYTLEARGRLDLTKRLNFEVLASHDLAQESRSVPNARNVGTRPDIETDRMAASLNQRFNRLTVQLRGSVTELAYGDSTTAGVTTSNAFLDYVAYEQAARASWEFKPTLSAFSEVAINQRDYRLPDAAGVDHSSTGERYRLGLSFGNTGAYLRGEVSAGWGAQHPTSRTLAEASGFLVDANATWRASALTSFLLSARSDFIEATIAGSGSVKVQAFGLDVRHSFERYLIGTAGIAFTNSDYTGTAITEQDLRETLGLEYYLNREAVLFGRYTHVDFASVTPGAS